MSADSAHAEIEKQMRSKRNVFDFNDSIDCVVAKSSFDPRMWGLEKKNHLQIAKRYSSGQKGEHSKPHFGSYEVRESQCT